MLVTYPKDFLEKVEFDKILDLLSTQVLGEKAKEVLDQMKIHTDVKVIAHMLEETNQYLKADRDGNPLPMQRYESIEEDLPLLKKDGYVLSVEAIRRIYRHIAIAKDLLAYFGEEEYRKNYPLLYQQVQNIEVDPALLSEIDRVLDAEGEVKPDASPELLKIHRSIRSKEKELDITFTQALKRYGGEGYLSDTNESLRNGRRVLTVAAEYKRRIEGVIHDESATGKTVYIEPSEVMAINNAIFNLYTERKKEVYKVLKVLCSTIRPYADDLWEIEKILIHLDVLRAKSKVAVMMEAGKPMLKNKPHFAIKEAYNPLLFLKNKEVNKKTVPFDLELFGSNRLMVVSGPNAGGKSVLMKSVGLIQTMVQFGMLVPVDENSTLGIFTKMFADIGDQQSIEDDLSTYSGRLKHMKHFIEEADKNTLVLIDEFGSGTDPKIGGAIAEAILKRLNQNRVNGIITTHYSNLKYFAFKSKGVVNGSMEFDKAKLEPTYQLIVGKPGSSFAYEIAKKIGLPKEVLSYARHKVGKNEKAIDELLTNLQSEKKEVEDRMAKLLEKEDQLDKLTKTYNELHKELEYRRKKLKLQQKEFKLIEANYENRAIEHLVKELKEEKNLEKAQQLAEEKRIERKEVQEAVSSLQDEVLYKSSRAKGEIKAGGYAKMRSGGDIAEVLRIEKNKATLKMGFLNVEVPLSELMPADQPIKRSTRSVKMDITGTSNFQSTLDLRGYSKADADYFLEEFLDKALINNVQRLKVLHGIGNGVLQKLVNKKVKEYPDIKKVWHPEEEFGGKGVTFISF